MLNKAQIKGISLLMKPMTVTEAAAALGMNVRTVQRWFQDPEFVDTLKRAVDEQIDAFAKENSHGIAKLAKLSRDAIERILSSPREASPADILRAAAIVQGHLIKLMELRLKLGGRDVPE
jgi:hypothetical protein